MCALNFSGDSEKIRCQSDVIFYVKMKSIQS